MDEANQAMCFALRNPGSGEKPSKLSAIRKLVRKTDGKKPSLQAISLAAVNFKRVKGKRGRRTGSYKTTKQEDKLVLKRFKKLRPPGHGVDSNVVHRALPLKLRKKIGRKTIIRRLAKKGFQGFA
jgi:hypothetical protein